MMELPLDAWLLFGHAETHFADVEIVSAWSDGRLERCTLGDFARRAQQLMHGLDALGITAGATVGTLAWNSARHLEAYFGVPCTGRVLHTLNLRLSPEELAFIVDDAGDEAIIVDADLVPLLEKARAAGGLAGVRHVVVMAKDLPDADLPGLVSYEDLIATQPTSYDRRRIDERQPLGVCYTSGTTGRPKGVVYTHRSTVLHTLVVAGGSAFSIGPSDCVLPVVPMFHANAWGMPYAATMVGAKQVFLGGSLDCSLLVDLFVHENVTVAAGVPTVWLEVADEIERRDLALPALRHIVSGGAQPPRALIARLRDRGIPLLQAWGMTETSPLASVAWPKHAMRGWHAERVLDESSCQAGLPLPTVDLSIRADESDDELPWDGEAMGRLLVRGPYVVDGYLHGRGAEQFVAGEREGDVGWFATGDVAVGTPGGYFRIADRTKDLIKSGGEWISSVDMEAALMALPDVAEAAVVAVPDPKWLERPLACVVLRDGAALDVRRVKEHLLETGFAKWQLPDRVEVLDAIPRTSVGKFDKKVLRARFADAAGTEGSA
ncbi:MAG TPA: long-chain-fatty-acid--CoA ligase [Mycobacteriales bacterium]|jgi:fatty-acyl-CoA synthase|nr:long-chain-fatty-acid--CoA ligase [Mycobacteriales bacterium]